MAIKNWRAAGGRAKTPAQGRAHPHRGALAAHHLAARGMESTLGGGAGRRRPGVGLGIWWSQPLTH